MGKRFAIVIGGVLALAALAPAASAQAQPQQQKIDLMFAQTANRGTMKPIEGPTPRFNLKLRGVNSQVVWFPDRPGHQSGQTIPTPDFIRSWAGFGFAEDRPNAALTLPHAGDGQDTVVVELGRPDYLKKENTVRYSVRLLGGRLGDHVDAQLLDEATGSLSRLNSDLHSRVNRRFRAPALFIDDATGPVAYDNDPRPSWCGEEPEHDQACVCIGQPYFDCHGFDFRTDGPPEEWNFRYQDLTGANLRRTTFRGGDLRHITLAGADLTKADLGRARLDEADLTGAILSEAILSGADLIKAKMARADLRMSHLAQADLTGADLTGAKLGGADLSAAILARANLRGADLSGADLFQADLTGLDLTGVDLKGAKLCQTIMPDGTENNRDC